MLLDLKDRKILYQLDKNSRQSFSQIGKKVGLKKDVVSYRVKKLEEERIINNYLTVIDAYRLGFLLFRYYINFQYVDPATRKKIIDYFTGYKNICTVGSVVGKYDLVVVVWVQDINEFYQFWNTALNEFGNYFETRIFSVYIRGIGFLKSYLLLDDSEGKKREICERFGVGKTVQIDKIDYQILNELALNARIPLVELADMVETSSQTIQYRIKKLKKLGIIQCFRVAVNAEQLGFKRFKVDIYLKEHKQKDAIISHIKSYPSVIYISTSVGLCDLELEMIVESSEKIIEIIEEINMKFPNVIRTYSLYGGFKIYKETFLPSLFD